MKDIVLKITGKVLSALPKDPMNPANSDDAVELITAGKLSSRGGITRISYEESEISGMQGCTTQITISEKAGTVKLRRSGITTGDIDEMEFEKGTRYEGTYSTPFGDIDIELMTADIDFSEFNSEKKKISMDYYLAMKGLSETHNRLELEVLQ